MEEAIIHTCKDVGVPAQRICKLTGVWTLAGGSIREKKIAAIGVHVSQAVTSHGFALNVTTDLRDFDWIVPCGIADRTVTSLELESPQTPPPTLEQAANSVSTNFGRIFQRQMLAVDSLDELLATHSLNP
jgi:lipoyl(octanoyl) transferase